MEPIYPEGTPEYEAYRAELRTELTKWARGDHPYEYPTDKELSANLPKRRRGRRRGL